MPRAEQAGVGERLLSIQMVSGNHEPTITGTHGETDDAGAQACIRACPTTDPIGEPPGRALPQEASLGQPLLRRSGKSFTIPSRVLGSRKGMGTYTSVGYSEGSTLVVQSWLPRSVRTW